MLCKWKLFLLFRLKKFEAQTKCEINLKITPTWSKGKTHQYCSRRLSSSTSDMAIERVVELPEPSQVTPEKRKETPKKRKQIHARTKQTWKVCGCRICGKSDNICFCIRCGHKTPLQNN